MAWNLSPSRRQDGLKSKKKNGQSLTMHVHVLLNVAEVDLHLQVHVRVQLYNPRMRNLDLEC